MQRHVYRLHHLIACRAGPQTLLFSESDFDQLYGQLLQDIEVAERLNFAQVVMSDVGTGGSYYRRVEREFCSRVDASFRRQTVKAWHKYLDGEAAFYLPDFLTAFQDIYLTIEYSITPLDGSPDGVVEIVASQPRSLVNAMLRRRGKFIGRRAFLLSDILSIEGNAWACRITTKKNSYMLEEGKISSDVIYV